MKKFTKKFFSVLLSTVIALSVLTVAPFAATPDLAVSVEEAGYLQGSVITATIYFPTLYNKAAALDMKLEYDRTKLEFVSIEKGVGLQTALNQQTEGKVYSEYAGKAGEILWVVAGTNNFVFNGVFATVTFKVRDTALNGKTALDIEITNAATAGYVDITSSFVAQDAEFEILRNTVNDFDYKLSDDGQGYIITAYRCATVSELTVPDEYNGLPIIGIGDSVFYNHGELKTINLPDGIEFIGDDAFYSCVGIEEMSLPHTVKSIGSNAFFNCVNLKTIQLPLALEEIKDNAFFSCFLLKEIDIPFNVKTIGDTAFYNCISLMKVKISKNTVNLGKNVFEKCYSGMVEFVTVSDNTSLPSYIQENYPNSRISLVEDISLGKAESEDIELTVPATIPPVKVTLDNGDSVTEGKDYIVACVNNHRAGTATVYVAGVNGYGEGYTVNIQVMCKHESVKKLSEIKALTCTQNGEYRCQCTVCGEIVIRTVMAKGHPLGKWVYDKLPTTTSTGIKHKVCTVCGQPFELNTIVEKIVPDVNLDGKVNSGDALLILQHSVGKDVYISPEGLLNADGNGDGNINSADALIVLKISVGK